MCGTRGTCEQRSARAAAAVLAAAFPAARRHPVLARASEHAAGDLHRHRTRATNPRTQCGGQMRNASVSHRRDNPSYRRGGSLLLTLLYELYNVFQLLRENNVLYKHTFTYRVFDVSS